MKYRNTLATLALTLLAVSAQGFLPAQAEELANKITPTLDSIEVMHKGKKVTIQRDQDKTHLIPKAYSKTSRRCPPFCIRPMHLLPGVETVGELEVIGYLKQMADGSDSVLVVDSRTTDWLARGTIPGSVNIPWNRINVDVGDFEIGTSAETLDAIMQEQFGAVHKDGGWDFSKAKTLVLFCNGLWCGQSSINIKTLARLGYPSAKLKWYRGGMQDWVSVGLTTVRN